ncbi:MAG: hypothetical protein OK439_03980 [Thaumarchaeota archaeon]|nr:hypothetical protein [Nitrososphaerota archaeon]
MTSTKRIKIQQTDKELQESLSICCTFANFTSAAVLQASSTAETIVYNLSTSASRAGYYSFVFPFTCQLQPVLYIGNDPRNLDFTLFGNWLLKSGGHGQTLSLREY